MKHKILIVDDDENIRVIMNGAFAGEYTVFTAPDGETALAIIKSEKPFLVFLDITMPGISGLDLLKLIKETGLSPVIWMLTGEDDLSIAIKALEMGAVGYQTKPFDIKSMRDIVANAVSAGGEKHPPVDKPWSVKKSED